MRKLHYIFAGLILITAMVSCEKQNKDDLGIDALKAAKITYSIGDTPGPTSFNGIIPEIIPGENKGGNRTCEEVWLNFGDGDEVCGEDYLCGDKVDYDDNPEGFASSFPDGLKVTVSGIHIEFEVEDGCLEFEGIEGFWKVGAVIVKGSNAANVYWYPEGETFDSGLAAPGDKHMVSNLTFCFVRCDYEAPELVIAFKSKVKYLVEDDEYVKDQAYTKGLSIPTDPGSIQYNVLGYGVPFVIRLNEGPDFATITATEVEHAGAPHIQVDVAVTDGIDWIFYEPHLYIGTLDGLDDAYLPYTSYPFDIDDVTGEPCSFLIPVSAITL